VSPTNPGKSSRHTAGTRARRPADELDAASGTSFEDLRDAGTNDEPAWLREAAGAVGTTPDPDAPEDPDAARRRAEAQASREREIVSRLDEAKSHRLAHPAGADESNLHGVSFRKRRPNCYRRDAQ